MKTLLQFYIGTLSTVAVVLALGAVFVPTDLLPFVICRFGQQHWLVTITQGATSRLSFVVLLAGAEWLIRKKAWRWKYPRFDFEGKWNGKSTYTQIHVGTGQVGHSTNHEVTIEQDCLSLRITPSEGEQFLSWNSTATNLLEEGDKLVYAYEVRYGGKQGDKFPTRAFGYEEMSAVQHDDKGRPTKLNGSFYHCAHGQSPVYSGEVVFERVSGKRP